MTQALTDPMDWLPRDDTPLLDAALAYASHGLRVIKVHGITAAGTCTCGRGDCSAQGKHPIDRAWQRKATSDVDAVRDARRSHPQSNIGIALGGPDRLIAIDIDGPAGRASWEELERNVSAVPITLTARSGRTDGGEHRIYRVPPHFDLTRVGNRAAVNGLTGIDTRANNGQIVAPPSVHRSGARYTWVERAPIADIPEWLFEAIATPPPVSRQRPEPLPANVTPINERYVRQALDNAAHAIAACQEGGRNSLLFAKACTIFEYCVGEQLDHQPAWRALADSARAAGLRDGEIGDVLSKAWRRAQANPRTVPAPQAAPSPRTSEGQPALVLDRNANETVRQTLGNVMTVLSLSPEWAGVIAYDLFGECVVTTRPPPVREQDRPVPHVAGDWSDEDTVRTAAWLGEVHGLRVSPTMVDQAIIAVARRRTVHPVRDWLAGLDWDRTPRLDSLLCRYFGAPDTPYTRGVSARWAISAIARVMAPGCQADCTLVLESREHGTGKSTGLETLCGRQWFADTGLSIGEKDSYQCLRRKWIYELGELSGLKGRELHRTKNFLSARSDNYRASYARRSRDYPRQSVFAGTTNEDHYLEDRTGNRRFLPVRITAVDREAIARDREQLWAEAYHRYHAGEPWHVDTAEFRALAEEQQSLRVQTDPWEEIVAEWLERPLVSKLDPADGRYEVSLLDLSVGVSTTDVLLGALRRRPGDIVRSDETRAGEVLRTLGMQPRQVRRDGRRVRIYFRPGEGL